MRSLRILSLSFLAVALLIGVISCDENNGGSDNITVTILHNNDGESQLINAGQGIEDFGGIARFATLVNNLRAIAESLSGKSISILLSSGDNFLAGPEFAASQAMGIPFFDSIGLEQIGYDAFAIGNHEFDFGPDTFEDFLLSFNNPPPFVSANLDFTFEPGLQALRNAGVIVERTIIEKKGVRIGIVGATTPGLASISSPRDTIILQNVAGLVQGQIDQLQAEGVNIIILISHLQGVDEDLDLATVLTGLDVMIAGGGDEILADEGDLLIPGDELEDAFGSYPLMATGADGTSIPVVTTPGDYKYLGRLIVEFDRDGNLLSIDDDSSLVRVAGGDNLDAVQADAQIQADVVDPVQAFISDLAANVIATSEVALEGRRDPGIRTQETNLGSLCADAILFQANELAADFDAPPADVALQNGGGIRNNNLIPPGDITELTTFDIFPFSNFVSIVPDIPRTQFKAIMENAVSEAPESDGRFAQISGFSMVYDPAAAVGSRVQELMLDGGATIVTGGAVVPGDDVNIAIVDFSARGGDDYPFNDAPFIVLGASYQQALFNYITSPNGLNGVISAMDYPEIPDGSGNRITTVP